MLFCSSLRMAEEGAHSAQAAAAAGDDVWADLRAMLSGLGLERRFACLVHNAFDVLACLLAEDQDWDEIGVPLHEARAIRAACLSRQQEPTVEAAGPERRLLRTGLESAGSDGFLSEEHKAGPDAVAVAARKAARKAAREDKAQQARVRSAANRRSKAESAAQKKAERTEAKEAARQAEAEAEAVSVAEAERQEPAPAQGPESQPQPEPEQ